MRFSTCVFVPALLATRVAGASLQVVPRSLETSLDTKATTSTSTDVAILNSLDGRNDASCSIFDRVISRIGTSTAKLGYFSFATAMTGFICIETGRSDTGCMYLAAAVGSALTTIFYLTGKEGTAVSAALAIEARSSPPPLGDFLREAYAISNSDFDSIDDITPHLEGRYEEHERKPLEVVKVQGLRHGNVSLDFDVYDFGDGDGHIVFGSHETNDHERRSDAPGFKISYTLRQESLLTSSHMAQMAGAIAQYWASMSSVPPGFTDFIGFVETEHDANFYYRIIPELENFALNYESVDICGGMGGFL